MDISFLTSAKPEFLAFAAFLVGVFVILKFVPRLLAGVPFVEAKAVHDMIREGKEIVVIDVRTDREFHGVLGHIGGALNLPVAEISDRLDGAGGQFSGLKGEPIFITCRTENRSPRAAKILTRAGFSNVSVIKGGMVGWNKHGLPVVK